MVDYGKELILDLHNCNANLFQRGPIERYFETLCNLINMERAELFWWDDLHTPEAEKETEPHLVGTSAIQFIRTSNITIHTLDILERVYLNVFSCKEFDSDLAAAHSAKWFDGKIVAQHTIRRI